MNSQTVLEHIYKKKIIAIVRGVDKKYIVDTAKAILDGGIDCLEITINHKNCTAIEKTYESIELLKEIFGDKLYLGAGTVLSVEEVDKVIKAGAQYIISPDMNTDVIRYTKEADKISIPGAFTPTEVVKAHEAGADIVKVFPAGLMGAPYIKALKGPLAHIPLSAVGGITPDNVSDFLKGGCCCVGIGGNLVDLNAIYNGNYKLITEIAKAYVQNVNNIN